MVVTPFILAFLLIFVRVMAVIGTAPLLGNAQVPVIFKIGLSFFLALIVDNTMSQQALLGQLGQVTFSGFIGLVVIESLTGVAIGLLATFTFAVTQFAGELLDVQVGFSIANIIAPGLIGPSGLLANFYYLVFALWFLSVNGHYAIILALLDSFRVIPLGAAHFNGPLANVFLQALVSLMTLAVQFAAPVLLALFLTNVSLAVASRAVPQMNVFVVGLPISLMVGLIFLALIIPDAVAAMQNLLTIMENQLGQALRVMGGG